MPPCNSGSLLTARRPKTLYSGRNPLEAAPSLCPIRTERKEVSTWSCSTNRSSPTERPWMPYLTGKRTSKLYLNRKPFLIMTSYFSFPRLLQLIRKQWIENSRFYLLSSLALVGMLALVFAFWISGSMPDYHEEITYVIFLFGLFITGT